MNYKNHTIKIVADENPSSPRENDNLSKLYFFGGMKGYGDKHDLPDPRSLGISTVAEHADWFKRNYGGAVVPIYGYSHSGVTLSLQPFSCKFDSGCAGFAVVDFETITKNFDPEGATVEGILQKCNEMIKGEIEALNKYLSGEAYGYQIFDSTGEEVTACYGYDDKDYALAQAVEEIDAIEQAEKERAKATMKPVVPQNPNKSPFAGMNMEGMKVIKLDDLVKNPQGQQILEYLHKIMGLQVPPQPKPTATPPRGEELSKTYTPPPKPTVAPQPKPSAPTNIMELIGRLEKMATPQSKPCGCASPAVPLMGKPVPKPAPASTPVVKPPVVEKVVPKIPTIDDKIKSLLINPKTGKSYSRRSLQRGKQLQKITNEVKKHVLTLVK